jgi:hypothetical protein
MGNQNNLKTQANKDNSSIWALVEGAGKILLNTGINI